jgi:hypothetical protein
MKQATPSRHIFDKLKNFYSTIAAFFHRITPKFLQNYLALWAPISLLLCLQPMANWLNDKNQITDIGLPLIFCLISGALLATIFYHAFIKNRFLALTFAIIANYAIVDRVDIKKELVWNFAKSSRFLNWITDTLGLTVNLIILVSLASVLLYFLFIKIEKVVKSKNWNLNIFFQGAVIAIVIAFGIQTVMVLHIALVKWPQFFYQPSETIANETLNKTDKKPDIYYIVPDRYTNQTVLKEQFNFDNSNFTNFLKDNGFYINPNAYGSYPNTITSISSTFKANYHNDLTKEFGSLDQPTAATYFNTIHYSPVVRDLKKLGYSYYHLGTFYDLDNQAPLADHVYSLESQLTILNHTFSLNNFTNKEFTRSIYADIARYDLKINGFEIFSFKDASQPDFVKYKLSQLQKITSEPAGSKFVFAHFLVPHDPYFFNADGSISDHPLIDNVGKPVKEKYTGQISFINNQIKDLVAKIKEQTNNKAVIIIQADEGDYASHFVDNPTDSMSISSDPNSNDDLLGLKLKYGVMAAYYIPEAQQKDLEIAADNVNIFRLVLNTYFNANLSYLPKCSYAFKPDSIYKYTNITQQLTGNNPNCP